MSRWAFVDDQPDAAATFAQELTDANSDLDVFVVDPAGARASLLGGGEQLDGVLIDVDLSDVPGEHGSGPGIAQDIRINQENGCIRPFPIVRFSSRVKVLANIGGDASSDDLFDLKIDKEVAAHAIESVRKRLIACAAMYQHVVATPSFSSSDLAGFLGLTTDQLENWTHPEFIARAESARADKPHISAGLIMRFLTHSGPLISEELLSVRLGVAQSSTGWAQLQESLSGVKYTGKGDEYFPLWWARGVEDWWLDEEGADTPLSSMTIDQRIEQLMRKHEGLTALKMPDESPGRRPWRLCALSLEEVDPSFIPVDPAYGIRLLNRGNAAPWADPAYAALGIALQHPEDRRINRADLEHHAALWKK
jgi:hypothetical protein